MSPADRKLIQDLINKVNNIRGPGVVNNTHGIYINPPIPPAKKQIPANSGGFTSFYVTRLPDDMPEPTSVSGSGESDGFIQHKSAYAYASEPNSTAEVLVRLAFPHKVGDGLYALKTNRSDGGGYAWENMYSFGGSQFFNKYGSFTPYSSYSGSASSETSASHEFNDRKPIQWVESAYTTTIIEGGASGTFNVALSQTGGSNPEWRYRVAVMGSSLIIAEGVLGQQLNYFYSRSAGSFATVPAEQGFAYFEYEGKLVIPQCDAGYIVGGVCIDNPSGSTSG